MECSMPGSPVPHHHQSLPEFMSTELVIVFNYFIFCHPLLLLCHSLPATKAFSVSQLFTSGGPKYWSFSCSISPSNDYSGLISLKISLKISLQSKGILRVFYSTTIQKHQSLVLSLFYGPNLISVHDYWKDHSFDNMDLFLQSDALLFNILSRFVIAFLPRSKYLLISGLQSPSTVILEPKKRKTVNGSTFPPFFLAIK